MLRNACTCCSFQRSQVSLVNSDLEFKCKPSNSSQMLQHLGAIYCMCYFYSSFIKSLLSELKNHAESKKERTWGRQGFSLWFFNCRVNVSYGKLWKDNTEKYNTTKATVLQCNDIITMALQMMEKTMCTLPGWRQNRRFLICNFYYN